MGLLRLISCLIFLILILDSEGLSFGRFGGFKSGGFKSGGGFKFGGGFKSGGFKSGGLKTGGFKWGGSKGSSKGGSFGKSGGGKTRLSTTYYSSSNHLNYGWNYHETPPSHYSRSSKAPYDPPVGFTMYKRPGAENTIAKEAAVHSTTAVVVTHVVPGGIYGTWGSPWGPTYYYQSNGQKKRPKTTSSPNAPGFTTWSGRNVTLNEFQNLTEDLLKKDVNNAAKFITIKLQGQKTDNSTNDIAPEPLLTVKNEAWSIPTVKAVLDLHDNYNMDIHVKEVTTDHEAKEQDEFLDLILQTEIMNDTIKFLVDNGYVKNNRTEFKKTLRDIWFWQFGRTDGDAGSSGFESVFLAEKFDSDIIGLHNWIYYAKMEANGTLNYLGYIRNATLGDKGALLKVRSSLNGTVQPVTSFFVGTSPELEIALYTLCFYALPNHLCPVKLAGNDVVIMVNAYSIDSKNITASAYPDFRPNSAPAQTPFAILGVMSLLVSLIIFNPLNTGLL